MKGLKIGQEVLVIGKRCEIVSFNWFSGDCITVKSKSDGLVFEALIDEIEVLQSSGTLAAYLFPEIYKILIIENERQPILQRSNVDIVADRAVSYAKMGAIAAKEGGL